MNLFTIEGKISGRVRWTVYEKGQPVDGGWWNSNLITNYGKHAFGINSAGASTGYPEFGLFRRFCAVGTGTTAPTFNDTTLVNEVARSSSTGGFPFSENAFFDDGGTSGNPSDDFLVYKTTTVRYFTFANAVALGEYGFFENSSGGTVTIRELFRDGSNNPVVLNLQAGRELKIEHELTVKVPFRTQNYSFNLEEYDAQDVLVNTTPYSTDGTFYIGGSLNTNNIKGCILNVFAPSSSVSTWLISTSNPSTLPGVAPGSGENVGSATPQTYDIGTSNFTRVKRCVVNTSIGNIQFRGVAFSYGTSTSTIGTDWGLKAIFVTPTSFTKAATHLLEIEYTVTWDRG